MNQVLEYIIVVIFLINFFNMTIGVCLYEDDQSVLYRIRHNQAMSIPCKVLLYIICLMLYILPLMFKIAALIVVTCFSFIIYFCLVCFDSKTIKTISFTEYFKKNFKFENIKRWYF